MKKINRLGLVYWRVNAENKGELINQVFTFDRLKFLKEAKVEGSVS